MPKNNPFEQDPPKEYDIFGIMEVFHQKFLPVSDIADATDFFTTQEIVNSILDINPVAEFGTDSIIAFLEENNYQYIPEPGKLSLHFKWMVKRIS